MASTYFWPHTPHVFVSFHCCECFDNLVFFFHVLVSRSTRHHVQELLEDFCALNRCFLEKKRVCDLKIPESVKFLRSSVFLLVVLTHIPDMQYHTSTHSFCTTPSLFTSLTNTSIIYNLILFESALSSQTHSHTFDNKSQTDHWSPVVCSFFIRATQTLKRDWY